MGKNFRKTLNKAKKTSRGVDTAQTKLIMDNKKAIANLAAVIETKYNVQWMDNQRIKKYDGDTVINRNYNIIPIMVGENAGVSDIERVGDEVTLKHLSLKYQVYLPVLLVPTVQSQQVRTNVRVIMFWDNQPSTITTAGGLAVNPVYWPQLLQQCTTGIQLETERTQPILSERDWDNRKRFSIVYDQTHSLYPNSNLSTLTTPTIAPSQGARSGTAVVSFTKKYEKQKMRYVAGGTIVQNRGLYLAYLSDASLTNPPNPAALPSPEPLITWNLRALYEDA